MNFSPPAACPGGFFMWANPFRLLFMSIYGILCMFSAFQKTYIMKVIAIKDKKVSQRSPGPASDQEVEEMARTVGIGIQAFEKFIERDCFYVDKTMFIKEWWNNKDDVYPGK